MNIDQLNSVEEILDFAIGMEESASQFYLNLAEKQQQDSFREMLNQFAAAEQNHKEKLQKARATDLSVFSPLAFRTINLTAYIAPVEPGKNLSHREILALAMQEEKKTFSLYVHFAGMTEDTRMQDLFLMLAREEANHKLYFEIKYDKEIQTGS